MPEEIVTPDPKATPPADQTNLKAEMDRKIGNIEANLKKATDTLAQQLAAINQKFGVQQTVAAAAPVKKTFRDAFYEDEDAAIATVKKETRDEVFAALNAQNRQNQILGQLYTAYPELADVNNDLTKKALEIHQALSEDERLSPLSYKVAVADAADQLGVLPMSKRKTDSNEDEDFVMGQGRTITTPGKKPGKGELPPEMLEFATSLGLDVSDSKIVDSIKGNHRNSQDWQRYQPIRRK